MGNTGKSRSRLRSLFDSLRRLLRRKRSPPPADPYAYTMAPLRRGPKGPQRRGCRRDRRRFLPELPTSPLKHRSIKARELKRSVILSEAKDLCTPSRLHGSSAAEIAAQDDMLEALERITRA